MHVMNKYRSGSMHHGEYGYSCSMWDAIDRKLDKERENEIKKKKRLSKKDSRFNLKKSGNKSNEI